MNRIVKERKIKHWQGYGAVDAKVISKKPNELVIKVSGEHEYGLDCGEYDTDRVYEWLVKRFEPTKTERDIETVDIDDRYEGGEEVCYYTIKFRDGDMWQEESENNPRFKMMESDDLKWFEKTYGKAAADALVKYCDEKGKEPSDIINGDDVTMSKFAGWAKRKLGIDIYSRFGNYNFDSDLDSAAKRRKERFGDVDPDKWRGKLKKLRRSIKRSGKPGEVYDAPSDFDLMQEGSGSRMDEYAISDKIYDYLNDCEWVEDIDPRDDDILITVDGRDYSIVIEPETSRLKRHMSDDEIKELGYDMDKGRW